MSISLLSAYQAPVRAAAPKVDSRHTSTEPQTTLTTTSKVEQTELELPEKIQDRLSRFENRRASLMGRLEKFSDRFEALEGSDPENDRKRLRFLERTTKALERTFSGVQRMQLRVDSVLRRIEPEQQELLPAGKDGAHFDPSGLVTDAQHATIMRDLSDDLTSTWKNLRNSFGKKDSADTEYGQRFEALGEKLSALNSSTESYRKNVLSAIPPGSQLSLQA